MMVEKLSLCADDRLLSRQSSSTIENLESHKLLIEIAKDDLEAHLEDINEKLEHILGQTATELCSDMSELSLKEERLSTEKCLQICASLSGHIDQLQRNSIRGSNASSSPGSDTSPESITNESLKECKESLVLTVAKLESHMRNLMDRMLASSEANVKSNEDFTDLTRLREEWETTRQCIDICSRADTHLKGSVTTIDNYGIGDAMQFMVSTNGKVIHGKNRGLGWRTRQVGGHLSDDSVMQLSRDMAQINFRSTGNKEKSQENPIFTGTGNQATSEYSERYGRGFMLTSKASPDDFVTLTTPATHYTSKSIEHTPS